MTYIATFYSHYGAIQFRKNCEKMHLEALVIRQHTPALSYGSYTELQLTNRQYAFARDLDNMRVIITVNNDDNDAWMNLPAGNAAEYVGTLTGQKVAVEGGCINVCVGANSGEIWVPTEDTSVPETFSENKDSIVEETPVTQEEVKNEGSAETKTASASSVPEAASTKEDTDRTPLLKRSLSISIRTKLRKTCPSKSSRLASSQRWQTTVPSPIR